MLRIATLLSSFLYYNITNRQHQASLWNRLEFQHHRQLKNTVLFTQPDKAVPLFTIDCGSQSILLTIDCQRVVWI